MSHKSYYENLQFKSSDVKLCIIEELEELGNFTDKELIILDKLASDNDDEIRARVAEVLVSDNSEIAQNILLRLVEDKEELVRVNACDSLCNSNSIVVLDYLKERILKDKSNLVRGYAALSIVDIALNIRLDTKNLVVFFQNVLKVEKDIWVKINLYKVLYLLGDKRYFELLIDEINNRCYRNRCAVVNILADLLTTENFILVKTILMERLKVEKTNSVVSSINKVISFIEEKF